MNLPSISTVADRLVRILALTALCVSFTGCANTDASGGGSMGESSVSGPSIGGNGSSVNPGQTGSVGGTGVTQAGAQDFGLFRKLLEEGKLPAPSTLDAMGFFAELTTWLAKHPDPDLQDDAKYIDLFIDVLNKQSGNM